MATGDEIKLPLTSRDVNAERVARLRELFPEAFTEGKIDLTKFPQLLGDAVTDAPERYGLSWSGKSEAIKNIQTLTSGTLLPCSTESWPPLPFAAAPEGRARHSVRAAAGTSGAGAQGTDAPYQQNTSENLIIEGDNLEVLKLLQGGYHGRVKMIYIDPPYNTGGEFIYPDNYKEGLADYLKFSGQVSGEGIRLTTNAETDGRYHSKWLTMMYPRLFLARNLLREDGMIFVSIDDHEVHNLRAVMNEIFGEENFVAQLVWDRNRKNDARYFSVGHEYMLVYFRNEFRMAEQDTVLRLSKEGVEEVKKLFTESRQKHGSDWAAVQHDLNVFFSSIPADDPRQRLTRFSRVDGKGPYRDDGNINWPGGGGPRYEVIHPVAKKPCKIPTSGWRYPTHERFQEEVANGRIVFGPDETTVPRVRTNLFESTTQVMGSVNYSYAQTATNQFTALFDGKRVFENPKPVDDLKTLAAYTTCSEDIILDFFAGSGTTAQAVLELNAQDGGNRKFILVQLPEPTGRKDFPTIADITKERVRRVIKKLETETAAKEHKERKDREQLELGSAGVPPAVSGVAPDTRSTNLTRENFGATPKSTRETRALPQDLGFKVFKLSSSNFKVWDAASAPKDAAGLAEQLKLMAHNVVENRGDDAVLYELVLKSNLPLAGKITSDKIGAQIFYDVAEGALAICLERKITPETLRGIMARKPKGVICLDIAFAGNDQLKANIVLEMKSHGIEFHTA